MKFPSFLAVLSLTCSLATAQSDDSRYQLNFSWVDSNDSQSSGIIEIKRHTQEEAKGIDIGIPILAKPINIALKAAGFDEDKSDRRGIEIKPALGVRSTHTDATAKTSLTYTFSLKGSFGGGKIKESQARYQEDRLKSLMKQTQNTIGLTEERFQDKKVVDQKFLPKGIETLVELRNHLRIQTIIHVLENSQLTSNFNELYESDEFENLRKFDLSYEEQMPDVIERVLGSR